jgi:hypothetical protein
MYYKIDTKSILINKYSYQHRLIEEKKILKILI